jgi:hypothetical protein
VSANLVELPCTRTLDCSQHGRNTVDTEFNDMCVHVHVPVGLRWDDLMLFCDVSCFGLRVCEKVRSQFI